MHPWPLQRKGASLLKPVVAEVMLTALASSHMLLRVVGSLVASRSKVRLGWEREP